MAEQYVDAVAALWKKANDILEQIKEMSPEDIVTFNQIYKNVGYAYVDSEDETNISLVVGFEETVDETAYTVASAFMRNNLLSVRSTNDNAEAVQRKFAEDYRNNALEEKEYIERQVCAFIEKLTRGSVSISEDWEYSPATTKFEIFVVLGEFTI